MQFEEEEAVPITSLLCQWNAPRKRKESAMPISKTTFQKHVYSRQQKHELKPIDDFDPRPLELRGKATELLSDFLDKVRGQGLGVSLLFDQQCRCWSSTMEEPLTPKLPTKEELRERVEEFKKSLLYAISSFTGNRAVYTRSKFKLSLVQCPEISNYCIILRTCLSEEANYQSTVIDASDTWC